MSTVTPLESIEQAVQQRTQHLGIDVSTEDGLTKLRSVIYEETTNWNESSFHNVGVERIRDTDAFVDRVIQNLIGYGPLDVLLNDPDVWEIMINAPDEIFVKRHSTGASYHHQSFTDDDHVYRTITRLIDNASSSHRKLDPAEGLQDAQLDDGSRVHIVHRDIGRDSHMLVNIRRFTGVSFRNLDQLVEAEMLTREAARYIRNAVREHQNIVFSGAPGAGKTTLMTCAASELEPTNRVVIAEEVFETDIGLPNVAHMQTRAARSDRAEVDLRQLAAGFLRMAPDVAIVGEVRDREALPLLMTLSSGVQGFTTLHASSARHALTRLRFICQLADQGANLPLPALNQLVSDSIDVVVHCERHNDMPQVAEIVKVDNASIANESTGFTTTTIFSRNALGMLEEIT